MDSKLTKKDRMNRISPKDKKQSDPEKAKQKKRGGGANGRGDDEEDVDSRGNIRGLITYSDETDLTESEEESPVARRKGRGGFQPRKAAVKASEKIKKKLDRDESPKKSRRRMVVESESEEEESWSMSCKRESMREGSSVTTDSWTTKVLFPIEAEGEVFRTVSRVIG